MHPGWALVEIILLWLAILVTTIMFWKISRAAAILFFPYLGWVTFAAVLNGAIWWLNRGGVVPVPGMQV
jgi:tryptophan-rich sensory protein